MTEASCSDILPRGGTILGTTNRGNPFAYKSLENNLADPHRILGSHFGVAASDLVASGKFRRMLCLKAGKMASVSLHEALEKMRFIEPSREIVHAARAVGATFGDGP